MEHGWTREQAEAYTCISSCLGAPLTAAASECGYSTGDWPLTTQGSYSNAYQFFSSNNFPEMKCMFFSFANADASKISLHWDPVLGVDTAAARENALNQRSAGVNAASSPIAATLLALTAAAVASALRM